MTEIECNSYAEFVDALSGLPDDEPISCFEDPACLRTVIVLGKAGRKIIVSRAGLQVDGRLVRGFANLDAAAVRMVIKFLNDVRRSRPATDVFDMI